MSIAKCVFIIEREQAKTFIDSEKVKRSDPGVSMHLDKRKIFGGPSKFV